MLKDKSNDVNIDFLKGKYIVVSKNCYKKAKVTHRVPKFPYGGLEICFNRRIKSVNVFSDTVFLRNLFFRRLPDVEHIAEAN